MDMADLLKNAGFPVEENTHLKKDKKPLNKGKKPYKNSGNYSNKGKYPSGNKENYVHAPYNFVPFSKQVVTRDKSELIPHNSVDEQLFTGEIAYDITAKTPIFIDNGKGGFHQNMYGDYSIPGSTMRGLIRNNVQILGLSGMADDIDDYSLMYRNVAAGLSKNRYQDILGSKLKQISKDVKVTILKNVKAGYISNENGKYYIYETVPVNLGSDYGEMNYYPLSEKTIIYDYLDSERNYFYEFFDPKNNILQNEFKPRKQREAFVKRPDNNNKIHYKGEKNPKYLPYYKEVSYEVKDLKSVTNVGKPGVYSKKGYVVSSGFMNEKKVVYVIPEIDRTREPIQISEKDVQSFQIDYNKRKNKLPEKDRTGFFHLPENGETKPVFFIHYSGKLYFGFTPRLRVFYDHSIKEGLPKTHKEGMIDYAKAMFGYANDQDAYKSKVSFTDAIYSSEDKPAFLPNCSVVLGEPNPTAILQYVQQNPTKGKGSITYDMEDFQLRGVKQYWIHSKIKPLDNDVNEKIASPLHPMKENAVFSGKIRFRNLKKEELGLLLWSVTLRPESCMNIGKAKSYGYGAIKLNVKDVNIFDLEAAYKAPSLYLSPYVKVNDVEEFIHYYKETVKKQIGNKDIEELNSIKEFFVMKDSTNLPVASETDYMTLNEFKDQLRNLTPLPVASKVVSKKN
ncbi:MAG: TIGR03986 family CRISPR-associated RAMP protein [Lachnospiraceae bacterium]|nr:TIGR03986 family CRISPR-associated RAMP protein [Lachnospiraceae bacterium]